MFDEVVVVVVELNGTEVAGCGVGQGGDQHRYHRHHCYQHRHHPGLFFLSVFGSLFS